jgi:hypothetical protein
MTRRQKLLFIIIAVLLLIGGVFKWFSNGLTEYYSQNWTSESIEESKAHGAFIKQARIVPSLLKCNGLAIEFKEAWIEQQMQKQYSFLFFSKWVGIGNYRFCFRLKDSSFSCSQHNYMFVLENEGHGFVENGTTRKNGNGASIHTVVYNEHFQNIPTGEMKMSLAKSFRNSERLKNISILLD